MTSIESMMLNIIENYTAGLLIASWQVLREYLVALHLYNRGHGKRDSGADHQNLILSKIKKTINYSTNCIAMNFNLQN